MNREIEIKNIGPIEHLRLTIPAEGGVVVLRGENGVGKSSALESVHALGGGADPLSAKDGEEIGEIAGMGARLSVSKRRSLKGELSVESIASDIDPGSLIDPGLKDPEAADMERARVLCALAGVKPSLELFKDVKDLAGLRAREAKTLPEMAKWLKRDLEDYARRHEEAAAVFEVELRGIRGKLEGINLQAPSDDAKLREEESAARHRLATLEAQVKLAADLEQAEYMARTKLEELLADPPQVTAKQAQEAVDLLEGKANIMNLHLDQARETLRALEAGVEALSVERKMQAACLERAIAHEKHVADLRAILAQDRPAAPKPEDLGAADYNLQAAQKARDYGAIVRHAQGALAEEARIVPEHRAALRRAEDMRSAAARVWPIVAEAVSALAPEGLTLKDGRVMLETDRGPTFFSDLSDGERASIALSACIKATPEGGLLTIPQRIWEGLDPENRALAHRLALEKRITVLTAEASAGELRAEPFSD